MTSPLNILNRQIGGFFISNKQNYIIIMSLHIHTPKNKKDEFDSHKKLVVDIRTAVAEQKRHQHIVDIFMIGMFIVFLMYTVVK